LNKRSFLAILIAILLPLAGYFLVKQYSKDAVHMPHRYFYDSVIVKPGSEKQDTVWHKVKNLSFTNQLGEKVSLDDLHGKILVIDFFFTHCPTICPGLARSMKKLQDSFKQNDSIVQFISISIDPEHDSVPNLRKFADKVKANSDSWWFVAGDKKETYDFGLHEIKANIADTNIDTAFIHTENFFLLDTNRVVRGWYNGFDTAKQAELVRAIPTLMLERDKNAPSVLRDFIPILPLIFIGIGLVIVIMAFIKRTSKR
jgi:protein SCO1/2